MSDQMIQIPENQGYWLVRTEGGRYYEDFASKNFIAIGWDKFTNIEAFRAITDKAGARDMIDKIKNAYPDKKRPQHDYNQIQKFVREIKEGDFVVIPGFSSYRISFGKVVSDVYVTKVKLTKSEEKAGVCPFIKRRDVQWLKTIKRDNLDPYLYKLFFSHHTISNALEYGNLIDRSLYSLYIKGNKAHLILDVKSNNTIFARDLTSLINGLLNIAEDINKQASVGANLNEVEMKINVQSPGVVELKGGLIVMLLVASAATFTVGGKFNVKVAGGIELNVETSGAIEKIIQYHERVQLNSTPEMKGKVDESNKLMSHLKVEIPKQLSSIDCHKDNK
jgi:restriction system protein